HPALTLHPDREAIEFVVTMIEVRRLGRAREEHCASESNGQKQAGANGSRHGSSSFRIGLRLNETQSKHRACQCIELDGDGRKAAVFAALPATTVIGQFPRVLSL